MLASVGNFIASLPSWLSPTSTAAPSHGSPAEAPPPHQRTPLHATMRDPTTTKSALKRAAPVEDGLMPEQFYTLNPEFLTDTEKWTYRDLQRLAKQLGVPGGGKGSRKELEERLADFNRENERALDEDPERWPQQASNFNLVPVNIELKHAAATSAATCRSGRAFGAAAPAAAAAADDGNGGGAAPAVPAGLVVDVPSALRSNTSALISPLVASSKKRKAAGGLGGALAHRPASALRKKSKYSPSNKEYLRRIEATRSDPSDDDEQSSSSSSPASASGGGGGASGVSGSAAAAAAHKASPAINFSPFNRVNLIPAKEEYDEYKADFDPDVKTLF